MSQRGKPITKAIKEQRRKEAAERQIEYDKLTTQQKLDRLPSAPHCKKQRDKLFERLSVEQGKKSEEVK